MDTVQAQSREEKGRKAIKGAFFGFFVDMFDIYLPVIVLAPAIKYFVSPELSDAQTSLITGAIFAATLVGRPDRRADLRPPRRPARAQARDDHLRQRLRRADRRARLPARLRGDGA